MVDDEENRGDVEFSNTSIRDVEHPNDKSISKIERGEKIYSYDEALDLTGPIITAYPWGYFADTRGRRRALLIAIWGSLVSSVLSAFSFNWIMLAILKLLSSSFSGGIQSISYTLLGEMCAARFKNTYILILSSTLMSAYFIYTFTGYIALNTSFTLNIGFITFTPWRLLTLILASSLGTTLLCFALFHESPKFLLNAGHHEEALDVLKYIHKNNGGCNEYPTVCTSPVNLQTLLMALIQGVVFTGCSFLVATVADRKKMLLISILLISGVSGVISVNVTERILGIVFFFGVLLSSLCIGIAFSYFVDLYPTSYRGMASCVGIMVARSSAVFGVNLLGAYIVPHCTASFYLVSAFTFSAVIASIFLPPDKPKEV
ncbi:unnamed protein product, partial [Iphiclides podalirius]